MTYLYSLALFRRDYLFIRYLKALIGQDTRIIGLSCHDVSKPKVINVYTKTLGSSRMHKKKSLRREPSIENPEKIWDNCPFSMIICLNMSVLGVFCRQYVWIGSRVFSFNAYNKPLNTLRIDREKRGLSKKKKSCKLFWFVFFYNQKTP